MIVSRAEQIAAEDAALRAEAQTLTEADIVRLRQIAWRRNDLAAERLAGESGLADRMSDERERRARWEQMDRLCNNVEALARKAGAHFATRMLEFEGEPISRNWHMPLTQAQARARLKSQDKWTRLQISAVPPALLDLLRRIADEPPAAQNGPGTRGSAGP